MLKEVARSEKTIHFYHEPIKDVNYLQDKLGIDEETLMFYANWYEIDGELYYFKEERDIQRLVNELLGVHLANYFKLDTIEYNLGMKKIKDRYQTGLLSKSVYEQDKQYKNLYTIAEANAYGNINENCLDNVLDLYSSSKEKRKVILQVLRMSILDFYSHQVDRVYPNIDFQIFPSVSLGPLYDYEETFDVEQDYATTRQYLLPKNYNWYEKGEYTYQNDLVKFVFPSCEVEQIFNEYPEIYKHFIKILDLDLEKYLRTIEKTNDIKIPDWLLKHYMNYDKEQKSFVRKIK